MAFSYRLLADLDRLRIPVAAPARRTDGLWQHSCFEAFLRVEDSPAYYEFNFSPSGEWAAYGFRAYRDGGPIGDDAVAPSIAVAREVGQLTVKATVQLGCVPLIRHGDLLRIGLSAVIEAWDGSLSYWALKHPCGKADFHHADSFALELAVPFHNA